MAHEPERKPDQQPDDEHHLLDQAGMEEDSKSSAGAVQPKPPRPVTTGALLGRTLGGRYRFDELLGEGTFARVFRVHDLHRRADLAAKVLRSDIAHEPALLERFRREAAVLERLQHPNIVRYYDIVEVEGVVFILTDHIPGQTLQTVLFNRHGQPVTPSDSLLYLTPLASALHYAHGEGVVHRDLKPANILLDESGQLYVTDFGIARILSEASTLTVDTTVGTPHYMSPEQILAGEVTPATDIYALGVMLYQMYTGQLPFQGMTDKAEGTTTAVRIVYEHLHVPPEPPRNLNPRLSSAVQDVVLRCLEKDLGQRYGSVSEMYDALNEAIGTPSVSLDAASLAGVISAAGAAPDREQVPVDEDADEPGPAGETAPEWELSFERKQKPKRKRRARQPHIEAQIQSEKEQEKENEKTTQQQEKEDEKGQEKNQEKGVEKSDFWGSIAPGDRLSQFTWGGILLWAGVAFLLNTSGVFGNPMAWILSGAGALLLGEVGVRMIIPEYRTRPGARLILGVVLLMVGLGIGFSLASLWPLLLIAIGVGILANYLLE
ncbi:MAG: serine/threonine protein kinase [Anaerolineae bacterium]|nr:serine/threonine protein kinase [Anaerolineae bacterium]